MNCQDCKHFHQNIRGWPWLRETSCRRMVILEDLEDDEECQLFEDKHEAYDVERQRRKDGEL